MTDEESKSGVSPVRKAVSIVVLLVVLILLGIEGRAGFGHSSATAKLQDLAPQGAFKQGEITQEQLNDMMPMSPTIEEVGETVNTVECRYSWKSVIRPLMSGMTETEVYVTFTNSEPRYAVTFGTEKPEPIPVRSDDDGDSQSSSTAPPPPMLDLPLEQPDDQNSANDGSPEGTDEGESAAEESDGDASDGNEADKS